MRTRRGACSRILSFYHCITCCHIVLPFPAAPPGSLCPASSITGYSCDFTTEILKIFQRRFAAPIHKSQKTPEPLRPHRKLSGEIFLLLPERRLTARFSDSGTSLSVKYTGQERELFCYKFTLFSNHVLWSETWNCLRLPIFSARLSISAHTSASVTPHSFIITIM